MKEKSKVFLLIFTILMAALLCSCSKNPKLLPISTPTPALEKIDRSWLTGEPCRSPCWYGLSLGTSSMIAAKEKAVQLPFIDSNKVIVKGNSLFLYCQQPEHELCANLYFKNDQLIKIWMNINYQIRLKEVVNIIGPPDFLSYKPITPSKTPPADCFLELFWVDRQMTVRYYDYHSHDMCQEIKNSGNKLSPDFPVQEVWYLMPDNFKGFNVDDGYFPWASFVGED